MYENPVFIHQYHKLGLTCYDKNAGCDGWFFHVVWTGTTGWAVSMKRFFMLNIAILCNKTVMS